MDEVEYYEGNHEDFIKYLFSNPPKQKGEIKLELPNYDKDKNDNLHLFEQLLMIFVDGLKFFYSDENNKVSISKLNKEDLYKINQYFNSINYEIKLEIFNSINEYQFKFPNYFNNQDKINSDTKLEDFFYETYDEVNVSYRISFSYYN